MAPPAPRLWVAPVAAAAADDDDSGDAGDGGDGGEGSRPSGPHPLVSLAAEAHPLLSAGHRPPCEPVCSPPREGAAWVERVVKRELLLLAWWVLLLVEAVPRYPTRVHGCLGLLLGWHPSHALLVHESRA